jgi:hypothetical protein
MRRINASVVVPAVVGCLLRVYEVFVLDDVPIYDVANLVHFSSVVPYLFAIGLSLNPRLIAAAAGFASACLVADLYAHYLLYRGPGTDSLFVVFLPLWNSLFIGPVGAVIAWLFMRWRSSSAG